MIVKNESRIMRRCIEAAAAIQWMGEDGARQRLVGAMCLVDTGSADNTKEIATETCAALGIPLRIVDDPWVNFGHNRSRSFLRAVEFAASDALHWDLARSYALLLDADMELQEGEAGFGWEALRRKGEPGPEIADLPGGMTLMQRSGSLEYFNVRFVRLDLPWRCIGATHEYWSCKNAEPHTTKPRFLYIRDVGDGGAKADKFERDIRLLTEELRQDPNNVRAHFYLAQSLNHCGRKEESIAAYEKRIALGGWWEERWYAKLALGRVLLGLGRIYEAECWLQRAAAQNTARAEPLLELATAFRTRGENLKAAHYARAAAARKAPEQGLFVELPAHSHRPLYERTILDYYLLRATSPADALHASLRYLADSPGAEHCESAFNNLPYYILALAGPDLPGAIVAAPEARFPVRGDFAPSSVSVLPSLHGPRNHGEPIWANVRYVNYRMAPRSAKDGRDVYTNAQGEEGKPVTTRNALVLLRYDTLEPLWEQPAPFWETAVPPIREACMIRGYEDVRLEAVPGSRNVGFTATQRQWTPDQDVYRVAAGAINPATNRELPGTAILPSPENRGCEKNWIAAGTDPAGGARYIYEWGPRLITTRVNHAEGTVENVALHETPWLWRKFRGSSNGSWFSGLLYFVVHFKYYDRPAKSAMTYVHCLVAVDPETLAPRRTSQPFYFAERDNVEYCLGLDVAPSGVARMWFSSRDSSPRLASVPLDALRWVEHGSFAALGAPHGSFASLGAPHNA